MDVETGHRCFPAPSCPSRARSARSRPAIARSSSGPAIRRRSSSRWPSVQLGDGVTLLVTARDASGATLANATLQYPANTEQQVSAAALANNTTLVPNESFDITLHDGSAILEAEEADTARRHTHSGSRRDSIWRPAPPETPSTSRASWLPRTRTARACGRRCSSRTPTRRRSPAPTASAGGRLGAIQLAYSINPARRARHGHRESFQPHRPWRGGHHEHGRRVPIVTSRQITTARRRPGRSRSTRRAT